MIRVFDSTDKTYETNGNVVLQPTYSNIHKEDNGEYYLDIETNLQNEVIKHIESEEGTNVDLTYSTKLTDVDATKQHEFTKMYGETQQDSTTGKNLYNVGELSTKTEGGVTFTPVYKNGMLQYINVNGTATTNIFYNFSALTLPAGGYKISGCPNIGNGLYIGLNMGAGRMTQKGEDRGFTLNSEATSTENFIRVANGTQINNVKIYPMIRLSSKTDDTYEPYTGGSPAPSPTYPFDIHNVSGDNTININCRNLLDTNQMITFQGSVAPRWYWLNGIIASSPATLYCEVQAGKTYTVSIHDKANVTKTQGIYVINGVESQAFIIEGDNTTATFTPNTTTNLYIRVNIPNANTDTYCIVQLEEGDEATEFKPTISQLISLGVENLVDTIAYNKTANSSGVISIPQSPQLYLSINDYVPLKPNTTYTITFEKDDGGKLFVSKKDQNGTFIERKDYGSARTFTTEDNVYQGFIYIYKSGGNYTEGGWVQLEKGSKANSYSEYGKPYIELNKIGTYQDYIYKENDIWYLHKEIGKIVLNGSEDESWNINKTGTSNWYYNRRYTDIFPALNTAFCNNYVCGANISNSNTTQGLGFTIGETQWFIRIRYGTEDTIENFKIWLSSHNTEIYYPLATPTDTEITDTTLLEQLENLNKMTLYEGINNISILPNDLVPTLKLHYNYVEGGDLTTGDYLKPNNIIVSNTPTGNQAFRITNIDKRTHKIKIKANHVFFDSLNYVIQDSYVVDKNCNDALDHLNNATDNTSPFTTTSDINTINSYRCVRKSLYEAINVVLERWGGHLVRDNFDIKVMNTIGQDNGVVVRYAKNLKDIEVDYNWDEVCTKILPVGEDGLMLDEIYLYGDIQYDIPYSKVIHFAQDVDTTPYEDEDGNIDEDAYTQALKNDLRSQANNYLQEHQLPQVNYTLQANLEKITDVGDIIQVIDERLGVNITTSLISFDYDPILERYTYLEFGNFKKQLSNLTEIMATQTNEIVSEATATTRITLENELNEATSKIWGVLGSSYVLVEGDKILILDSLPKETATNVIMLNSAGIGFSNTGINGTFTSAWTIDNVLNMQNINVINLTADLIKGGTLKLGSNLNQNGILEVYDESNNLIAELNKDGLKMFATDGGYILINTTVGFAGYDRNNVKIYWADGDEFHMKKSVVEEEITLVDKMRIIPITITDEYDQIINDGIGFVSTL